MPHFVATRRALNSRPAAAASDWWLVSGQTCVAAYQPKGAASLAASYVNLANPGTHDAAPGTAPTFDTATGWTFDAASSQYLTTGVIQQNVNWSIIVRFSGASTSKMLACLIGSDNGTYNHHLRQTTNDAVPARSYRNGMARLVTGAAAASGIMAYAGAGAYFNGATDGTLPDTAGLSGYEIYLGCLNFSGTAGQFLIGTIAAIAIYSTTLSAADVAALTARMQAL